MGKLPQALTGLQFAINVEKSIRLAKEKIITYNQGRPSRERLKRGHFHLLRELIVVAAADLRESHLHGRLQTLQHLPFFRASNPMLVSMLGGECSEKTIYNLRKRLEAAGLITGYRWRTSWEKYDLRISHEVLYIHQVGREKNVAALFYPRLDAPLGSPAYAEKNTALCSLLLEGDSIKQKQQAKGVDNPPVDDFDEFLNGCLPAELETPGVGNAPDNQPTNGKQASGTKNSGRPANRYDKHGVLTTPPLNWGQVTERQTAQESRRLQHIVDRLWSHCAGWNWYGTNEVARSQVNLSKIRLAEWFTFSHPGIWKALEKQLTWRIKRVANYTAWREANQPYDRTNSKKKERRALWFPPPAQYFDIRNTGKMTFRNTRGWWHQHLQEVTDKAQLRLLKKAKDAIRIAGYSEDPYEVEQVYGQQLDILTTAGQASDNLINQFNAYTTKLYGGTDNLQP